MRPTQIATAPILRTDYRPLPWKVERVDLRFELDPEATLVRSRLTLERTGSGPLVLDGEELTLLEISVDGRALKEGEYELDEEHLTLSELPDHCVLELAVRIAPERNKALSGLYRSSGNYCTQCEAEGFRRITFFPDRPDVMTRFTTEIVSDLPVMLSNGNRVGEESLPDGRRLVRWEDPFPKPSYLFALVAGNLVSECGTFTTASGRTVDLEVWVEPQNADKCAHALHSLATAMKWDEERFGLEYDLDLYMIVAVGDFNMGAMENKGLNVFNSKYVLARPETATDEDYENIEGVIGHEYFHNWTGNRVTCRDWFQLTLKEGLTVYRDQSFTADQTSAPVKRILDVRRLRTRQFPEDAGPMAHPIRPESYVAMDNFYTATVYEKGAEVVRMYETLLGREGFRRGMDLYFERHDGQAVTCDDFRAAMADANGADLDQFERWYSQAGTPRLAMETAHDSQAGTFRLTLRQACPEGQDSALYQPLHIPVRVALLGRGGRELPLRLAGEEEAPRERVLELREMEQTFVFEGIEEAPVPSILRGFSAPVILETPRTEEEYTFLFAHDTDAFNRWDAGQELFTRELFALLDAHKEGGPMQVSESLVAAFRSALLDEGSDGSIRALTLELPGERALAQRRTPVDPEGLRTVRRHLMRVLAENLRAEWLELYESCAPQGEYQATKAEIDRRRLRALALSFLVCLEEPDMTALAYEQFTRADNMSDAQAALACLVNLDVPEREEALAAFHARWHEDPLVLDKWFDLQAGCTLPGAPERVRALMEHPDFTLANPNRARSVLWTFSSLNLAGFHAASGDGYRILADAVLEIDGDNPQLAARLVGAFNPWRRYDAERGRLMRQELERIREAPGLSKNTAEIVGHALGE